MSKIQGQLEGVLELESYLAIAFYFHSFSISKPFCSNHFPKSLNLIRQNSST